MTKTSDLREVVPAPELLMDRLQSAGMLRQRGQSETLNRFAYAIGGKNISGGELAEAWHEVIEAMNEYSEEPTGVLDGKFSKILASMRLDSDISKSAIMHNKKLRELRALLRKPQNRH